MAQLRGTDYWSLREVIGGKGAATIGNNTTAALSGGDIEVRLHGSKIAVLAQDGRVALRHCGFPTTTTFDRLRQLLPAGWQIKRGQVVNKTTGDALALAADLWLVIDGPLAVLGDQWVEAL